MIKNIFIICLLIGFSIASYAKSSTLEKIIAKVNDEIITYSDFEEYWQFYVQSKQAVSNERLEREKLLEALIDQKVLMDIAQEKDLQAGETEIDRRISEIKKQNNVKTDKELKEMIAPYSFDKFRELIQFNLTRMNYLRYIIASGKLGEPSEVEIRKIFDENQDDFYFPDEVEIAHIVFYLPEDYDFKTYKQKKLNAEKICDYLKRHPKQFAEYCRKHSEDEDTKKTGGVLGRFSKNDLLRYKQVGKEYARAAFKMSKGQVSELLFSPNGIHIIKVISLHQGRVIDYDESKGKIRQDILFSKANSLIEKQVIERRNLLINTQGIKRYL